MNSTTVFGLSSLSWDLSKGKYEEIDHLPMMSSPGPVLVLLAAYFIFVLKVGPAFMRKREAFKLTRTLLLYNAVQVVISAYLVQRHFGNLLDLGLIRCKCYMKDDILRNQVIVSTWLYFAAKVTELLDTVFFVLRKKESQVSFLHLYHHSIMVMGTWAYLKYAPSDNVFFIGFFNSLVHVFMYTYYGLAALGPNVAKYLTWKKYMTSFQLIQFVSIFIQYVLSLKYAECPPSKMVAIFFTCNIVVFFFLFSQFYKQSYKRKSLEKSNEISRDIIKERNIFRRSKLE